MLTVTGGIILAALFFVLFLPLVIRALRWAVSAAAVLVMFGLVAFGVTVFVHSGKTRQHSWYAVAARQQEMLMQWQLGEEFRMGPLAIIPAGTILSGLAGSAGEVREAPMWGSQIVPIPLPITAKAMDAESAYLMLRWYPEDWDRLAFGPGIDVDALKAKAKAAGPRSERMINP